MIQELCAVIYEAGFEWKSSSLEYLVQNDTGSNFHVCSPLGERLVYKQVDTMEVLGNSIDARGDSSTSIGHRCSKAEGLLWLNSSSFFGPAAVEKK
eukprot:10250894-Karenia_brevis.AAC.1